MRPLARVSTLVLPPQHPGSSFCTQTAVSRLRHTTLSACLLLTPHHPWRMCRCCTAIMAMANCDQSAPTAETLACTSLTCIRQPARRVEATSPLREGTEQPLPEEDPELDRALCLPFEQDNVSNHSFAVLDRMERTITTAAEWLGLPFLDAHSGSEADAAMAYRRAIRPLSQSTQRSGYPSTYMCRTASQVTICFCSSIREVWTSRHYPARSYKLRVSPLIDRLSLMNFCS